MPHRNIGLFYSVRTPDEFAYEDELRALARDGTIELRQTVTRATDDADWTGRAAASPARHCAELVHDPATLCFICGPPALVDEMPRLLEEHGHPARSPDRRMEEVGAESAVPSTPMAWKPESTIMISPVTPRDAGLSRKTAASATSAVLDAAAQRRALAIGLQHRRET